MSAFDVEPLQFVPAAKVRYPPLGAVRHERHQAAV